MGLNDEINNFSKQREVPTITEKEDDYDHDYEEDWDDEPYESNSDYGSLAFKMYGLDELNKFNEEQKELDELITPWWKNLKVILTKKTFGKIGLLEYKKKHLLNDDVFEEVEIENVNESLAQLSIFESRVKNSYGRRIMTTVSVLFFYILLASWTGWNMVWYLLLGWSFFKILSVYYKHQKEQEWFVKARTFITSQDGTTVQRKEVEEKDTRLADIMAFNESISNDENNHWSIKIYDAVANLFTRKK